MTKYEMTLQVKRSVAHIKQVKPEGCFAYAIAETEDLLHGYLLGYQLDPEREFPNGTKFRTVRKWNDSKRKYIPLEFYDGESVTLELRGEFYTKDNSDITLSELIPEFLADENLGLIEESFQLYKLSPLNF